MTLELITTGLVLAFCWLGVLLWVITQLRFVIDAHHVRVMLLRLTLRKIALSDIEAVDTKAPLWNEHWCTTLSLKRVVRIRRKCGWFRNFIITPPDREAFIAELRGRLAEGQCEPLDGRT